MKTKLAFALMFVALVSLAQTPVQFNPIDNKTVAVVYSPNKDGFTHIINQDSLIQPIPDIRNSPWWGQITMGDVVIDTVRVTMIIGQVRTSTTEFNSGTLTWKKGYFINSKNIYLDHLKKPISNLYRVFSTFPWW